MQTGSGEFERSSQARPYCIFCVDGRIYTTNQGYPPPKAYPDDTDDEVDISTVLSTRWNLDRYLCLAFAFHELPYSRYPFDRLSHILTKRLAESRFQLAGDLIAAWTWLEDTMATLANLFQRRLNFTWPLDYSTVHYPLPSTFGYKRVHRTRQIAVRAAQNSREAFKPLIGQIAMYMLILDARCSDSVSYSSVFLSHDLQVDSDLVTALSSLQDTFLDARQVGVVVDLTRPYPWCRYLRLLMQSKVPVWLAWGANGGTYEQEYLPCNSWLSLIKPTHTQVVKALAQAYEAGSAETQVSCGLQPSSGQHKGETWQEFMYRRCESQRVLRDTASPSEQRLWELRRVQAAHGRYEMQNRPVYYYWEKVDSVRVRTLIEPSLLRIYERHLYPHRIFNDIENEWDICSEFGDDPPELTDWEEGEYYPPNFDPSDFSRSCGIASEYIAHSPQETSTDVNPHVSMAVEEEHSTFGNSMLLALENAVDKVVAQTFPATRLPICMEDPLFRAELTHERTTNVVDALYERYGFLVDKHAPLDSIALLSEVTCKEILMHRFNTLPDEQCVRSMQYFVTRIAQADGDRWPGPTWDFDAASLNYIGLKQWAADVYPISICGAHVCDPKHTVNTGSQAVQQGSNHFEYTRVLVVVPRTRSSCSSSRLALFTAIDVAQLIRCGVIPDIVDMTAFLVERGVPFLILTPRSALPPSTPLYTQLSMEVDMERPEDWVPSKADYYLYVRPRRELLRRPHLRVAVMAGGILWRLCKDDFDGREHAFWRPSEEAYFSARLHGRTPCNEELWEEVLTREEHDVILGVYSLIDRQGRFVKKKSFWPQIEEWWRGGLDLGYWSDDAERWYIRRLTALENDTMEPTHRLQTRKNWQSSLRFNGKRLCHFLGYVERESADYLQRRALRTA